MAKLARPLHPLRRHHRLQPIQSRKISESLVLVQTWDGLLKDVDSGRIGRETKDVFQSFRVRAWALATCAQLKHSCESERMEVHLLGGETIKEV